MDGNFGIYAPTQEEIQGNENAIRSGNITQDWVNNFYFALRYNAKGARAVYGARRNEIESTIQRVVTRPSNINPREEEFMRFNEDYNVSPNPNDIQLHKGLCEVRESIEMQIFGLLQGRDI